MDRDAYLLKLRYRRTRFALVLDELGLSLKRDADLKKQVGGVDAGRAPRAHRRGERRYGRGVSRVPKLPHPSNWQKFNDSVYAEWRGCHRRGRAEYGLAHEELVTAIAALPPRGRSRSPASA